MSFSNNYINAPLQRIEHDLLLQKEICLYIKRDDLIHPLISGNKWRKLKYNIQEAQVQKKHTLLTFGGAFSNHIFAVAAAGMQYNFKTIGIIRGEHQRNATLDAVREMGMQLCFIDSVTYKLKSETTFIDTLKTQFEDFYLIPEGGTNVLALQGTKEIIAETKEQLKGAEPDYWCVSFGTGGTAAGMLSDTKQKVLVFPALKGDWVYNELKQLLVNNNCLNNNFEIMSQYHFGGYAKYQPELIDFINSFYDATQIIIDPIYTGKLFYGIMDLIAKDYFDKGSKIVAIHTGGLQGIKGFETRFGMQFISSL